MLPWSWALFFCIVLHTLCCYFMILVMWHICCCNLEHSGLCINSLLFDVISGLVGKVDFTVRHLSSSTISFPNSWDFSSSQQCISGSKQVWTCYMYLIGFIIASSWFFWSDYSLLRLSLIFLLIEVYVFLLILVLCLLLLLYLQCAAYTASDASKKTWTMRTTFPEYVVALATIVGSVLFTVSSFL